MPAIGKYFGFKEDECRNNIMVIVVNIRIK